MPSPAASRRNLENARQLGQIKLRRCRSESELIKLLAWQSCFDRGLPLSQRALARQLGVSQPYICKVMRNAVPVGWDALTRERRLPTLADLEQVRGVTARMRERAPHLFAQALQPQPSKGPRVMTVDEAIAETWREVDEWKRKNSSFAGRPRTVQEWQELERQGRRFR